MRSLNGKTVLITGASSGIGAACAHAFVGLEARLLLAALDNVPPAKRLKPFGQALSQQLFVKPR